jgi:hypothetical protein
MRDKLVAAVPPPDVDEFALFREERIFLGAADE